MFSINGSLAAVCKPEVWEKLLKGEAVGVIEPDPNRWSLYIGEHHVKTYTALNLRKAIGKVYKEHPELADWVVAPGEESADTRIGMEPGANISNGYPYLIVLEPAVLQIYQEKGLEAAQLATQTREKIKQEYMNLHLAQRMRNVRAIDILGSQVHLYGMKREGKA